MMGRASGVAVGGVVLGIVAIGSWALQAQVRDGGADAVTGAFGDSEAAELERLLESSITTPFADATELGDVANHLAASLKIRVVLDPAALDRLEVFPEDIVQLDLEGPIRLRTALPLLLDQLGLTYKYVPKDRLLILTDPQGAGDPQKQILNELRDIHGELHDLQDVVNEMYEALMPADGPEIRKPTIIGPDQAPPPPPDDAKDQSARRSRPG